MTFCYVPTADHQVLQDLDAVTNAPYVVAVRPVMLLKSIKYAETQLLYDAATETSYQARLASM